MKAKIELDLDINGRPCVSIIHYDKSTELQQKILGVFLEAAESKGIELKPTNGMLRSNDSWERYEIRIK
ncbi:hypothetical protein [Seonamhaeicola sp.]|uniref:hypothetical protein n=1 Tax=Seonamhaeicola sp. TaxID=1912245 RepID=UPI00356507E4